MAVLASACGDDGGSVECPLNTSAVDGICLPDEAQGNSPANRRLCNETFGPVQSTGLYVDASYTRSDADGSIDRPFSDIQSAVNAASAGQEIGIAAGSYVGDVSITSSLSLEGRCARDVIVVGSISVTNTSGVAIRGLTVSEGSPGILANSVIAASGEDFGLQIRYIIATQNDGAGLEFQDSSVQVRDSEFTLARKAAESNRSLGSGIFIGDNSIFDIGSSVIGMNFNLAVHVALSSPIGNVIGMNVIGMNIIEGNGGGGVFIETNSDVVPGPGANLIDIFSNDFIGNTGPGVDVAGANVNIAANTFTGSSSSTTAVQLISSVGTIAINSVSNFPAGAISLEGSANVSVVGNTLNSNSQVGIISYNSKDITINSNLVLNTVSAPSTTRFESGHGIYIHAGSDTASKSLLGRHSLDGNTVADSAGVGVAIDKLDLGDSAPELFTMTNNAIARNGFAGISLQDTRAGLMSDNVLDANTGFGLRCLNGAGGVSRVFFDGNRINGTLASSSNGRDGDGVLALNCHVSVDLNEISNNARYGAYFDEATDGGCENNVFSSNQEFDLVDVSGGGMSLGGNGLPTTSSQSVPNETTSVTAPM